ncbi:zinc knuckle CX2CX4HX4C containing protein [Tanacetum coccineum]
MGGRYDNNDAATIKKPIGFTELVKTGGLGAKKLSATVARVSGSSPHSGIDIAHIETSFTAGTSALTHVSPSGTGATFSDRLIPVASIIENYETVRFSQCIRGMRGSAACRDADMQPDKTVDTQMNVNVSSHQYNAVMDNLEIITLSQCVQEWRNTVIRVLQLEMLVAARVGMQLRSIKTMDKTGETWAENDYDEFQRLFFKFDSWAGLEAVLEGGPWLIRKSLIIIKKWSMDTRLLKSLSLFEDDFTKGKPSFLLFVATTNVRLPLMLRRTNDGFHNGGLNEEEESHISACNLGVVMQHNEVPIPTQIQPPGLHVVLIAEHTKDVTIRGRGDMYGVWTSITDISISYKVELRNVKAINDIMYASPLFVMYAFSSLCYGMSQFKYTILEIKELEKIWLEGEHFGLYDTKASKSVDQAERVGNSLETREEPKLSGCLIRGLLRFGTVTSSQKQVMYLGELEELLDLIHTDGFEEHIALVRNGSWYY